MNLTPSASPGYRPFRLEITGTLNVQRFHTGGVLGISLSSDAPILRDTQGRPYLPGTSLRGVLRSHLEKMAGPLAADIALLFGSTPPRGQKSNSLAGRLTVCDAVTDSSCHTEVRDHVKLDRCWGAAASGGKFDQEIVSDTLTWRMQLIYEGESPSDPELRLVQEAIRALEAGDLTCGAKSGCGYGRLKLTATAYSAIQRSDPSALAAWLNSRAGLSGPETPPLTAGSFRWPDAPPTGPSTTPADLANWVEFRLRLQFDGVLLTRRPIPALPTEQPFDPRDRSRYAEKGSTIADAVYAVTGSPEQPFLPGSSLRGVLRHHAYRICKTFNVTPLADDLFGTIKTDSTNEGKKGGIEVSDGTLIGQPHPIYLDHVALDRITGFAADAKKFSTCGLASPSFHLTVRVHFADDQLTRLALLGLLLRDLQDGFLWAGSGVTRGYGHIADAHITGLTIDCNPTLPLPEQLAPNAVNRPGRRRLELSSALEFQHLDWLWRHAETAWRNQLPQEAV